MRFEKICIQEGDITDLHTGRIWRASSGILDVCWLMKGAIRSLAETGRDAVAGNLRSFSVPSLLPGVSPMADGVRRLDGGDTRRAWPNAGEQCIRRVPPQICLRLFY